MLEGPPKLLNLEDMSTKLTILTEPLIATLSIIPDALYHTSVMYYTLKCASSQNQRSFSLLKIPYQSFGKAPNPLKLNRDTKQGILNNV